MPLIADGEVLGALNVPASAASEVYFSESDFELVQLFAAQASIALRNADAHHAMSQRAETDALTGLGNHGAFQRDLGRLRRGGRDGNDPQGTPARGADDGPRPSSSPTTTATAIRPATRSSTTSRRPSTGPPEARTASSGTAATNSP